MRITEVLRRLLFLDFDGVLHPTSARSSDAYFSRAGLLVEALGRSPVEIVISSSWRFQYSLDELKGMLPSALAQRVVGTTGNAYIGKFARHQEILNYLAAEGPREWIALDDSAWEFPADAPLLRCDPNRGLTEEVVDRVAAWCSASEADK